MQLRNVGHVAGLALAKLLSEAKKVWSLFNSDDDLATVVQYEMGISDQTFSKYTDAWENVINHPTVVSDPTLQKRLMGQPIGGLLLCRSAAREGQLGLDEWEALANAPNVEMMKEIIRDVRGIQTSGHAAFVYVLEPDGTVKGRKGKGAYKNVAFVNRDDDEITQVFVGRLEKIGVMVKAGK
jgi:hypothetical protein